MNFRDRINPQKEEKWYIKFDFNKEEWDCDCEVSCTNHQLINWVANVFKIASRFMDDHCNPSTKKQIVEQWIKDLQDLYLDDKKW